MIECRRAFATTLGIKVPADDEHCRSPQNKPDIPVDPILRISQLIDVMDAEQVMINNAFHDIETTPIRSTSFRPAA